MKEVQKLYKKGLENWILGDYKSALDSYGSILSIKGETCGANTNMGVVLSNLGFYEQAESHFKCAMESCPEDQEILFNYSLHLLSMGEMRRGLELYENRKWNIRPPGEEWKGENCETLLVVPEQGNGDIIQFMRYLPYARKRCEKLIFMCFGSLVRIARSMGVADEVVEFNPGDSFVECDDIGEGKMPYNKFVRIMSIPHLIGESNIDKVPYIKSDPEVAAKWRQNTTPKGKMKVGLCWRGLKRDNEYHTSIDSRRSMELSKWSPILAVEGVEFYSLQKNAEDKDERVEDLMGDVKDFQETAGFIENLDLVISVDTAVAHLAGAMGKRTWLLNRRDSCWRWGSKGEHTPWYSNMRIFRQENMMRWEPVIRRVAKCLKKSVDGRDYIV